MRLTFGDEWMIETDELNWILRRKKKKRPGHVSKATVSRRTTGWAVEGYYATLDNALLGLHRRLPFHINDEIGEEALGPLLDKFDVLKADFQALAAQVENLKPKDAA